MSLIELAEWRMDNNRDGNWSGRIMQRYYKALAQTGRQLES